MFSSNIIFALPLNPHRAAVLADAQRRARANPTFHALDDGGRQVLVDQETADLDDQLRALATELPGLLRAMGQGNRFAMTGNGANGRQTDLPTGRPMAEGTDAVPSGMGRERAA